MNPLLIVANLKSNKTLLEAKEWLEIISTINKEIIVCPPFTLLSMFKQYIDEQKLPIKLGAQDISQFDEGPYTGEVNGRQIKEFADFVIIGHSERRTNFGENDEILKKKVEQALGSNLEIIYCIQDETIFIPQGIKIATYEPVFAIGTGRPDTPQEAERIAKIAKKKGVKTVLYGGSVTSQNVKSFTSMEHIDGVLVGGGSLNVNEFIKIIENA